MITVSWDIVEDDLTKVDDLRKKAVLLVLNGQGFNKDYKRVYSDLRGNVYEYTRAGVTLIIVHTEEQLKEQICRPLLHEKHVVFITRFVVDESIRKDIFAKNFKYIETRGTIRLDMNYFRPTRS